MRRRRTVGLNTRGLLPLRPRTAAPSSCAAVLGTVWAPVDGPVDGTVWAPVDAHVDGRTVSAADPSAGSGETAGEGAAAAADEGDQSDGGIGDKEGGTGEGEASGLRDATGGSGVRTSAGTASRVCSPSLHLEKCADLSGSVGGGLQERAGSTAAAGVRELTG